MLRSLRQCEPLPIRPTYTEDTAPDMTAGGKAPTYLLFLPSSILLHPSSFNVLPYLPRNASSADSLISLFTLLFALHLLPLLPPIIVSTRYTSDDLPSRASEVKGPPSDGSPRPSKEYTRFRRPSADALIKATTKLFKTDIALQEKEQEANAAEADHNNAVWGCSGQRASEDSVRRRLARQVLPSLREENHSNSSSQTEWISSPFKLQRPSSPLVREWKPENSAKAASQGPAKAVPRRYENAWKRRSHLAEGDTPGNWQHLADTGYVSEGNDELESDSEQDHALRFGTAHATPRPFFTSVVNTSCDSVGRAERTFLEKVRGAASFASKRAAHEQDATEETTDAAEMTPRRAEWPTIKLRRKCIKKKVPTVPRATTSDGSSVPTFGGLAKRRPTSYHEASPGLGPLGWGEEPPRLPPPIMVGDKTLPLVILPRHERPSSWGERVDSRTSQSEEARFADGASDFSPKRWSYTENRI